MDGWQKKRTADSDGLPGVSKAGIPDRVRSTQGGEDFSDPAVFERPFFFLLHGGGRGKYPGSIESLSQRPSGIWKRVEEDS